MAIAPADHVRGDAPLPIGRSGQGNQFPLVRYTILHLHGVANRPMCGSLVRNLGVDAEAAPFANLQPRRASEV